MSQPPAEIPPGLLVIAGVRTIQEADPGNGWPESAVVGTLDRRLLVQDQIWIDPNGAVHRLEDLATDYRTHIVETLVDMDLELEMVARVRIGSEMAAGTLNTGEARRDLDAIGELGRRWIYDSPLVRRLVTLGGISVPAALPPAAPAPHQSLGTPTELHDTDAGLWRVSTQTSIYLIDLDLRRFLRAPGAVRGTHINADGKVVWAFEFATDRAWHSLISLDVCRLGERMEAHASFGPVQAPIRSTTVSLIELAEPP